MYVSCGRCGWSRYYSLFHLVPHGQLLLSFHTFRFNPKKEYIRWQKIRDKFVCVSGIQIQSHGEGYALLSNTKELESKMLAYRLYRGHDISTICSYCLQHLKKITNQKATKKPGFPVKASILICNFFNIKIIFF